MVITMTLPEVSKDSLVMDGSHVANLKEKFTYVPDAVDRIFDNAASILSHCPGEGDQPCEPSVGIMIGKVQSGKTSNFIGLAALAMDNGYPLIVVLGGTKKNLVDQNWKRIKQYFDNSNDVKVYPIGGNQDRSSVLEGDYIQDLIRNNQKVILVVLKGSQRINAVTEMIRSQMNLEPILIIDDEGDEATLNGRVFADKTSSTYRSAVTLLNVPKRCGFISVTATPQGNYLIDDDDPLSPKFGILIKPGDGYCGLSVFHGGDKDRYYRKITDDDSEKMENPGDGFPDSFLKAFALFFMGSALRTYNGDNDPHAMLVHATGNKEPQFVLANQIKKLLDEWKRYVDPLKYGIVDDTYTTHIEPYLKGAYEDLRATNTHLPDFKELTPHITRAFDDCNKKILICNGDQDDSELQYDKKNNIFVGGNKLQRGITINGLSVTYMTRRAKNKSNVDTTEQRARWFGYRMKHLNVCRLFTTEQIEKDYSSILRHEQEFWKHIGGYLDEGYEFADIPRFLELDNPDLKFTRTNVARAKKIKLPSSMTQSYAILDNVIANHNYEISEDLFDQYDTEELSWGSTTHHITYGIPFSLLREQFLDLIELPVEGTFSKGDRNRLVQMMEFNNYDPLVDVIWMRRDNLQARSISPDGRINQLMSGSNSHYLGDRYFMSELSHPTHMKLQIHFIKPKDMDEYKPVMALHLQFSGHVRDKIGDKSFIRESDVIEN
jgi:hypothetical protein